MRWKTMVAALIFFGVSAGLCQRIPPTETTIPPPALRVDINHASVEELMKTPGMTRSWALRIVRFRPYRSKQDLVDQGIVTSEVYARIKEYIIAHRDKE